LSADSDRVSRYSGTAVGGAFVALEDLAMSSPASKSGPIAEDWEQGQSVEGSLARHNRQLEALYSISRTVNASLELGDVLHQALSKVLEVFDFPSGVLRLLDAPTGELNVAAYAGLSPEVETDLPHAFRLGDGPSGLAAHRRALVVVEDLADSPYGESHWARSGYRIFVSVPLQCRGMLLGCINMAAREVRALDAPDRELLMALANQVAMAVANAELYTAAQRKIQYLSALHQCSRDIGPAPDLERALGLTAERMALLLALERTGVLLWDRGAHELRGAASYPTGREVGERPAGAANWALGTGDWQLGRRNAELEPLPLATAVLREARAAVSLDPAGEGLLPASFVHATGIRSALAVPLLAHNEVIGLLIGDRGDQHLYLSADEMELSMIFANQAALWITGARLFVREHEARAGAEAAETKFRGLLESAPDGIISVDLEGRIVLLNTQAERMFGYSRDELLGQPIEILLPERLRAPHLKHRTRYHSAPTTRPMGAGLDLVARRKAGTEFPVEVSLSPLQVDDGTLITSVIRDITERKRAQDSLGRQAEELVRSNAELEQKSEQLKLSIREAHHRIKNNLQAISDLLYLELTAGNSVCPEDALRDSIERVQAIATVHDLLSQDEDVRVVDARAVMDRLIPMVMRSSGQSAQGLNLRTDVQAVPLSSKRATVLALIVNELVSNALKHAGRRAKPGDLEITLRQESEELVLRVQDTGHGLPEGFSLETHSHVGLDVVRILAERDLNGCFTLKNQNGVLAEVRFAW
jgi:PAS domain S-box-containing protein